MRRTALLVLLSALGFVAGCGRETGAPPNAPAPSTRPVSRSAVLVTIEAIRPDLLSTYGGRAAMPSLDRIAADGVTFGDATTPCPMVRPSLAAVFAGLNPDRSGVLDDILDRLPSEPATVATLFRAAGATTAGFVTTPFASADGGFDRGFDLFDGPEGLVVGPPRYLPKIVDASTAVSHFDTWLPSVGPDKALFAWIHLADLSGIAVRGTTDEAAKRYEETLAKIDTALGQVRSSIERSGRAASTDLVVVGTHGVHLGEGGARGGSYWLDAITLRVPLVWSGAGASASKLMGAKDSRRVTLSDVAATFAAIAGGPLDSRAEGKNLLDDGGIPSSRVRFAWSWAPDDELAWPTLTAIDSGAGWKRFEWPELRAAASDDARAAAERPARPRPRKLPDGLRKRIEGEGVKLGAEERAFVPSAADRNATIETILKFRTYVVDPHPAKMVETYRKMKAERPGVYSIMAGRLYFGATHGKKTLAEELGAEILERYPERPEALRWTAQGCWLTQEWSKAEALLEGAVAVGAREPDVLYDLACLRARQGDVGGAIEKLQAAVRAGYRNWKWIEIDPDLASVRSDPRWAELLKSRGR